MYAGVSAVILGEAALIRSSPLALYWATWFALVNAFILAYEEPTLRRTFGEAYDGYCRQVHRWLPSWPR
jgi:protein-S-isoprenylcysteine O-methyltransferase Ste14